MMVYEQVIYYHAHAHDMRVRAVVSAAFRSEFIVWSAPSTVMHKTYMYTYSYVYFMQDF